MSAGATVRAMQLLSIGSTNGHETRPGALMDAAHGSAARCIARTLVVSFDACDTSDVPLSQLQRAAILEAALLEFDGFREQMSSLATVSRLIAETWSVDPSAA
jgi:hypothetical protein